MSNSWHCDTCNLINSNIRSQCQACFTKRAVIASNKIKAKGVSNTQIKTVQSLEINHEFDASSNNLDSFSDSNNKYANNLSEHNDEEKDDEYHRNGYKNNNKITQSVSLNNNDGETKLNSCDSWRCQKCIFINNQSAKEPCVACGPQLQMKSKKKLETLLRREKSSPNDQRILHKIAKIYHKQHNYNDARTYYRKLLEIQPNFLYTAFWKCAMSVYRKNCMNSSQHRASSCFDFEGDVCKFIESKMEKNPNQNDEQFSLINAIKYKVDHLIDGFVRVFNQPTEIKHLFWKYYINDADIEMHDDKLTEFNQKARTEILSFVLSVLSPHDKHHLITVLTDLIKLVHCFKCDFIRLSSACGSKNRVVKYDNTFYYYGAYLSLLTFTSQQLNNMYLLLQEAGDDINEQWPWFWKNDYNIAILKLCQLENERSLPTFSGNKFRLKLLYELLNANREQYFMYYDLAKEIRFYAGFEKLEQFSLDEEQFSLNMFHSEFQGYLNLKNMKYVRTLCGFCTKYGSDIYVLSDILSFLCKRIQMERSMRVCLVAGIVWFWLYKELQHMAGNMCRNDDKIIVDIAVRILRATSDIDIVENFIRIQNISLNAFKSLQLVFFHMGLSPHNIIDHISKEVNFNGYASVIICTLRISEYNVIAWDLLNSHIKLLESQPNKYLYLETLVNLIDLKTGLLQKTIRSYVKTLNKVQEGNIQQAEINLRKAAQFCWKINLFKDKEIMNKNDLTNFAKLYSKMIKTKLIKIILKEIHETDDVVHIAGNNINNMRKKKFTAGKDEIGKRLEDAS